MQKESLRRRNIFQLKIDGHFFIIVSDGKVFTNNKYDDSELESMTSNEAKGTFVKHDAFNKSKKNSQDIFDAYSNVDGGFTKQRSR